MRWIQGSVVSGRGISPYSFGTDCNPKLFVHRDVGSLTLRDLKNTNSAILLFPLPGIIFARLSSSYPFVLAWIQQSQSHPCWTDNVPAMLFLPFALFIAFIVIAMICNYIVIGGSICSFSISSILCMSSTRSDHALYLTTNIQLAYRMCGIHIWWTNWLITRYTEIFRQPGPQTIRERQSAYTDVGPSCT